MVSGTTARTDARTHARTDGRADGRTGGRADGRTGGRTGGRADAMVKREGAPPRTRRIFPQPLQSERPEKSATKLRWLPPVRLIKMAKVRLLSQV
ncbi:hypothetical protein Q31b_17040 [Novipirellula aureliae]|uniref:Uncharacterized protein n=1 Tax=Novipirellula aureliae TaxID=2527966 RepID=A0A5C6E5R5_9BACT|nr:hypothetical protein Q31b_17040 [Novipirellula aureliae]